MAICQGRVNKYITVCGVRVDAVQIPEVIKIMEKWIEQKKPSNYIVTTNANTVVLSKKDSKICEAVNNGSLSVPDGISLVILARLYGNLIKKRVYGPDLMLEFMRVSEIKGYSNFFYGATHQTLTLLTEKLKSKFSNLKISGSYAPPFGEISEDKDKEIMDIINRFSPDVLWVALGSPKQDIWMNEHKNKLNARIMVGIGAAFDFLAGTKPQAPRWIRDNGIEWLFRLAVEPGRLWKRYLINNFLFLYCITAEFIKKLFLGFIKKPSRDS